MDDLISRQAAIDVIDAIFPVDPMKNEYVQGITCGAALAIEYVKQLPSAQPDNSCDGCKYENADDGVLVPCGFCKRSHPDNYERRTDERSDTEC